MIQGIDHVQITIPPGEEDAARVFYCGLLGLEEIEKPASLKARGGFWLRVGDRQVHVGVEDGVDRRGTKAHIAYAVSDLGRWREILFARGVVLVDGVPIPGYDRFEFRDPFGNRVEFLQPLSGGGELNRAVPPSLAHRDARCLSDRGGVPLPRGDSDASR
jgi:catechol 2,3-dioxygenase-like lactoylglutathione lyase family enzyme